MPDLLTVPEAMAVVRISRAKLYDPIRSGALMAISIGHPPALVPRQGPVAL
jgi:hypothetical protein